MNRNTKIYAVYEGETFICMGTISELKDRLGVRRDTIYKAIKAYQECDGRKLPKRIIFCLDEGENEV